MYINSQKVNITKAYTFPTTGSNEVTFKLTEQINFDYLFKDITALTSIKILPVNSNSILEIESMKNPF